jgi:hypothetical protein
MDTYVNLRRDGWADAEDLDAAATRSTHVAVTMPDDILWLRSYVLTEPSGRLGTVCIYRASSTEAIRRHADTADLPCDEIIPVADTAIINPDPN